MTQTFRLALTTDDIKEAINSRQIASLLGVEGCAFKVSAPAFFLLVMTTVLVVINWEIPSLFYANIMPSEFAT